MAVTSFAWFVMIQFGILAIGSFIFLGIMVQNFFKKRTMGTGLLAIVYLFVALRQVAGLLNNAIPAFFPGTLASRLTVLGVLGTLAFTYYFLYLFGSRHILHDNDIVRGIISAFFLIVASVLIGFVAYEMIYDVPDPRFYEIELTESTGIVRAFPKPIISGILYGLVLILVQIRYIYNLSTNLIRSKAIDPIRRIGTKYILAAIITLFLDAVLTLLSTLTNVVAINVIIYIGRFILIMLSLLLSYIGWILPNWFRKRIRQKAWIVKQLSTAEKTTATFATSNTYYTEYES
ncbi:MAG: hypothetical protein GF308_01360 [Candidatus Heimdallarchaeota archaeon]|nr:hypothetical protein [Candidatus Heimdallarchaeota archaeon]